MEKARPQRPQMRRWASGGSVIQQAPTPTSYVDRPPRWCRRRAESRGESPTPSSSSSGQFPHWVCTIILRDRVVVIKHELPHYFDLAAHVLPEEVVSPRRPMLGPIVWRDLDHHARLREALP